MHILTGAHHKGSEKLEVGIEEINYDTVETSSKNVKVSRKSST